MNATDRSLRNILAIQGAFYLVVNVWALVQTQHFLQYNNPTANFFEARNFAALSLVISLYFLAGAWRVELQRPAAFLGLGSALAIGLVEMFHLPEIGWSLLWADLVVEIAIAALYVNLLFFRREPAALDTATVTPSDAPVAAAPEDVQKSDEVVQAEDTMEDQLPDSTGDTPSSTNESEAEQKERPLL